MSISPNSVITYLITRLPLIFVSIHTSNNITKLLKQARRYAWIFKSDAPRCLFIMIASANRTHILDHFYGDYSLYQSYQLSSKEALFNNYPLVIKAKYFLYISNYPPFGIKFKLNGQRIVNCE